METSEKIHDFLIRNRDLFWHFDKSKLDTLPLDVIVEYILNYGSQDDVKELISIFGIKKVSETFFKNTKGRQRTNYFPEVSNFFTLYFNRNAH
ncbi:MAG: hypothetical protein H3C31_04110 [Brumimicrobium sp.]|nr:hypothetical protein [Brumimicrobium sp.]MCO5268907.1 hypothetical protein [Brumimicrobium sp.]